MPEGTTMPNPILQRIDEALKTCAGRSLVDIDEYTDALLDIRRLVEEELQPA